MAEERYKYCRPVHTSDGVAYDIFFPVSGTAVYLGRHSTIDKCIKILKNRFPKQKSQFTKQQMLKGQRTAVVPMSEDERMKRLEKRKFKYISKETCRSGEVFWRTQKEYGGKRYASQMEAVADVAAKRQCSIASLKLASAKLLILQIGTLQLLFKFFMMIYHMRYPADAINTDQIL